MNRRRGFTPLELRAVNSTAFDNTFGPFLNITGKETFDFTLLFEETILSIGPSALLLLLIPPRILRLWKTPRKVTGSYLQTTKIVRLSPQSRNNTNYIRPSLRSSLSSKSSMSLKFPNPRFEPVHRLLLLCLL